MPTVRRCCIVGCMSNSRLNPNLQFFQFPRPDNPFFKLWTQACQASLSRILPFKKPVLCASHFHPQCIGGRRLISSAVPTLRLEVPTNLKAVEQQAMVEEIERSRKCAYINAVVYEWLVRANLNPQLRGSITHGMIKEKAETAKQIIGCGTFMADNRWLNRFRESHLAGFAQKLASNQLKPMGPSLWIPDIVQDLQHLFPPTSAERIENFENVPQQYINYMKQYGEYEDDDDGEQEQSPNGYPDHEQSYNQDDKLSNQSYYQQHHAAPNYYQQQAPPPPPPQHHPPPNPNGYNPYNTGYNAYHDYYQNERHHQQHYQQQQPHHNGPYGIPGPTPPMHPQQSAPHPQPHPLQPPARPMSHSPPQQQPPARPMSHSPPKHRDSPIDPLRISGTSSPANTNKRRYSNEQNDNSNLPSSKRASPITNGSPSSSRPTTPPTAEPSAAEDAESNNNDSFKIKLPLMNGSSLGTSTPTPSSPSNITNSNSRSSTPKSQTDKVSANANGNTTNGHNSIAASPTPSSSETNIKELETYAQALEYLKPLEDFALFKENFRAIGLISQLENILKKANRPAEKITNGNN